MNKHIISFMLFTFIIGNCAPAPVSPTPLPTATVPPTITPFPTPSSIPTATPYPPLQTDGPYLLFTYDNKNFTIMDADGNGRKQFQLPNDGYIHPFSKSVSPDSKWLAYYTGSTVESYDITLNLLNLSAGTTQPISNLLAPDFPANLEPIVKTMVLGDPPVYEINCFEDMECRRSLVERELTNSLFFFDWSPDSESIVFPAQIDSPSSDLYIYKIQDKTIRQLTSEPQNIYWIDWAPNGRMVLYEISSASGNGYEGRTLHVTDLDGKRTDISIEGLYSQRWGEYDWISENLYLFYHPNDTDPPVSDLVILNTDTGQLKKVWPHTADSFAINRENNTIILLFRIHHNQRSEVPEGIYLVYPSGKYLKISDVGIQYVLMEGQKPYPIFAQDYNAQLYSINNNGSMDALPWDNNEIPRISPNEKFLLFREANNLALYTDSYQLIKSWSMKSDIHQITWRPDSLGAFFSTENNIYYLALPNGEPSELFVDCSQKLCEATRFV